MDGSLLMLFEQGKLSADGAFLTDISDCVFEPPPKSAVLCGAE